MATFRKKGDGWEVMVRRKGHKHISKTFPKLALGEQWARDKEGAIDTGAYRDAREAAKVTLRELFARYRDEITPTKEASSHVTERSRLGTLTAHVGNLALSELATDHVLAYVRVRLKSVVSDTIRKELQLLADVVDTAHVIWGLYVAANPVPAARRIIRKLRMLKPGVTRERRLVAGEYERIRDAKHVRFTVINQVALFAIETAMRESEIARALREHVDRARRVLYVPKSKMDWLTGNKGKVVPLSPMALRILDELPVSFVDGTLFGMNACSIKRAFRRLCAKEGLVDLRFHDLCREATSRLFEMGFTIEEVSAITGKKDWRILRRYTRPNAEKLALKMSG